MLNKGILAAVILATGAFLGISALKLSERAEPAPIIISTPAPTQTIAPTASARPIQVFVNGAVMSADVYILAPDSRVKQAIEAAGGFSEGANRAVINLAQPLADGVHIYVPQLSESTAVPGEVVSEPNVQSRSGTGGKLININTADLDDLDVLPGIGPAIAQAIIDYRSANGSFANIEAVLEVPGIGEVKFEQIRDLISTGN